MLLPSCVSSPEHRKPIQTSNHVALPGTEWLLLRLNDQPIIQGSRITLGFEHDSLGGYGGCNWYGGAYTATDASLSVPEIGGTARACQRPAGVLKQEITYYRALQQTAAFAATDDHLELNDHSGHPLLYFERRKRLAMNPDELAGSSWQLSDIDGKPVSADAGISLSFSKTGLRGFAGCRDYEGSYIAKNDSISVTSISMLATECSGSRAQLLMEGDYTTALSEAEQYRLRPGKLEILTAPGRMLIFVRQ